MTSAAKSADQSTAAPSPRCPPRRADTPEPPAGLAGPGHRSGRTGRHHWAKAPNNSVRRAPASRMEVSGGALRGPAMLQLAWTTRNGQVGERSQARLVRHRRRRPQSTRDKRSSGRYHDAVTGAAAASRGVRRRRRCGTDHSTDLLVSVFPGPRLRLVVSSENKARAFEVDPNTVVRPVAGSGDWEVVRRRPAPIGVRQTGPQRRRPDPHRLRPDGVGHQPGHEVECR